MHITASAMPITIATGPPGRNEREHRIRRQHRQRGRAPSGSVPLPMRLREPSGTQLREQLDERDYEQAIENQRTVEGRAFAVV